MTITALSLLLVAVIAIVSSAAATFTCGRPHDLRLMIGAPATERGEKLLKTVHFATDSINKRSDVLTGHNLCIIDVDFRQCGDLYFLSQFVNLSYHQESVDLVGAVAIFCPAEVEMIQQIVDKSKFTAKQVAQNGKQTTPTITNSVIESNTVLSFDSSHNFVRMLIQFFDALQWKNVATITETKVAHSSHFTGKLALEARSLNISVTVYNYNKHIDLQSLPRIILVSLNAFTTGELLCRAYNEDLMWPKHVWIIHTKHFETNLNLNASHLCNEKAAVLQQVLFLTEATPTQFSSKSKNSTKNESLCEVIPAYNDSNSVTEFYSAALHSLIWSMALTLNATHFTANVHYQPAVFKPLAITQLINNTEFIIAVFQEELAFCDTSFLMNTPSDKQFQTVVEGVSKAYTIAFVIEIVGGFILTSLILACYCCFRSTPEVKSTSFSLSLLVFLGCYFMLIYLSILLYFHQPWTTSEGTLNGLCISLNWFSGLGISWTLIFVTALIKNLRVYCIFNYNTNRGSRLTKACTDSYLAVYVALMSSPLILVHIVWTNVDPYLGILQVTAQPDSIRIQKQCKSNYTILWYALLASYITTILFILLVVAYKARKIKKSNFNDTKKVTIFVLSCFVILILCLTSWRILYTAVNAYYAAIVLHVGHFAAIVLCQLFLFVPKVFPPFIRQIKGLGHRQ